MLSISGSGGSGQKILLDGVEYKGELKLLTEYQWLEQSVLPLSIGPANGTIFISYKGELYLFAGGSYMSLYKLNGVIWEKIASLPDSDRCYPVIVGNELFALSKTSVYKVDTIQLTFTKIVDFPFVPSGVPAGVEYNGKLNVVFIYRVNSAYTYPHYELNGATWTKISEVPTDVYFDTYYSAIGVFNNELHILGGDRASLHGAETHIKLSGTSWIKDVELPKTIGSSNILIENDNIYAIHEENYYMYRLKNGAWEQYIYLNDLHKNGSFIRHRGNLHLLGGHNSKGYRKTVTNHFAYEKVLCLED